MRWSRCVYGPLFAPRYERIARTGPTLLATIAPSPDENVVSLRAHVPAKPDLWPSRMSVPVALPTVTSSSSIFHRSGKCNEYAPVVTREFSGLGPEARLYVCL